MVRFDCIACDLYVWEPKVDCSRVNQWVESNQEGTILGFGDFEWTLYDYALGKLHVSPVGSSKGIVLFNFDPD
jgi:hypothetical protein